MLILLNPNFSLWPKFSFPLPPSYESCLCSPLLPLSRFCFLLPFVKPRNALSCFLLPVAFPLFPHSLSQFPLFWVLSLFPLCPLPLPPCPVFVSPSLCKAAQCFVMHRWLCWVASPSAYTNAQHLDKTCNLVDFPGGIVFRCDSISSTYPGESRAKQLVRKYNFLRLVQFSEIINEMFIWRVQNYLSGGIF